MFYGDDDRSFHDICDSYGISPGDYFYEWWNRPRAMEDEEEDYIKEFTKLGQYLKGVEDV